jgi:hypothetical protein
VREKLWKIRTTEVQVFLRHKYPLGMIIAHWCKEHLEVNGKISKRLSNRQFAGTYLYFNKQHLAPDNITEEIDILIQLRLYNS